MIQLLFRGTEQALQKHLGLDAFWHGVTASSALIGCVIGSAFSGYFASGLGRRNSLRLAALLFFLSALGSYYPEFFIFLERRYFVCIDPCF